MRIFHGSPLFLVAAATAAASYVTTTTTSATISILLPFLFLPLLHVNALSSSSSSTSVSSKFPTTYLSSSSSSSSSLTILDGAEWSSIQTILKQEQRLTKITKFGFMNIVIGINADGQRIVAMQADEDENVGNDKSQFCVYKDSMAVIPAKRKISDADAISTYIASLSTIHPVLPKVENVGGLEETNDSENEENTFFIGGKSVILGSNDLACFAAEGLATLGVDVSLVSTNGNPKVNKNVGKLNVLKPAVGPSNIGFSAYLGKFDSMLDTLNDEGIPNSFFETMNDDDDDDDDDGLSPKFSFGGTVLELLKSRHDCERYVSTFTHSQSLIVKEGIFGGPRQAEEYAKRINKPGSIIGVGNPECQRIPPPKDFGKIVTMIFDAGLIFSDKQRKKFHTKSDIVKGWVLSDFWEQTTWPRDSNGSGNTRFGLPVVEDIDPNSEPLLPLSSGLQQQQQGTNGGGRQSTSLSSSRPPRREFTLSEYSSTDNHNNMEEENNFMNKKPPQQPLQDNPFVLNIAGVYGMKTEIVDKELDGIMFLSAKFCKTCKAINPLYTRMARLSKERSANVAFVKAEASGPYGKALGKYLQVDAVPAFVLFRKGKRFGTPLSVSKLPSKKIDRALELLETGKPWDSSLLKADDDDNDD